MSISISRNSRKIPTMEITSLPFLIIFLLPTLIHSRSEDEASYYSLCKPFDCGNITFSFPYSIDSEFGVGPRDCGLPGFQIFCESSSDPRLMLSNRFYQVKQLYLSSSKSGNQSLNLVTVVDHPLINDLSSGSCDSLGNLSIPDNAVAPLTLPSSGVNLTFFRCPSRFSIPREFLDTFVSNFSYNCEDGYTLRLSREVRGNGSRANSSLLSSVLAASGCALEWLPVSRASLAKYALLNSSSGGGGGGCGDGECRIMLKAEMELEQLLGVFRDGFQLEWANLEFCEECKSNGGRCGYDSALGKVDCFCEGGHCQQLRHTQVQWKLIVGAAAASCFIVLAAAVLSIFVLKRRLKKTYSRNTQTVHEGRNAVQFIKEYRSAMLTNYSYNDIKKMSCGFKDKLGEGGFGSVYLGKTSDGRQIAIKMLEKSNHEFRHDFINEVVSIGRIHHVNVIRLLGFCWDGSKQALVYEYMPNGSLWDLMSKEGARLSLGLPRLLEIAIGVAHGIEYLHNGCDSRILHLDIKPQNILLDQNLNPKVSDFGLAKVYSRDRSAVSVTGARGTVGYIAPEIFLRSVGNPSHKSDVYSYGMLLLDMVGGKKHVVTQMIASSEEASYFPDWFQEKVDMEEEDEEEVPNSFPQGEVGIAKKMVMVGLWCIQMDPKQRPSMSRVVEMLCGSAESIQMPPKPLFSSSSTRHSEQEITHTEIDTPTSLLFDSS